MPPPLPADSHREKLLCATLKLMCHLAATPLGRSRLAAAGCLPRWLARIPQLRSLRQLQLLLMVVVSCLADWTVTAYFEPLMRRGVLAKDRLGTLGYTSDSFKATCPPLLMQQVR
jgi:hypothetical protein